MTPEDIRDLQGPEHEDITCLNFIRSDCPYEFRRHYRSGLRSHIIELLDPLELKIERHGVLRGARRWYPRARPIRMLRIFKRRFHSLEDAGKELARVKLIAGYLAPSAMAVSEEFLATYILGSSEQIILCGLQEYVEGEIIDPWGPLDDGHLGALARRMGLAGKDSSEGSSERWIETARNSARNFTQRVKELAAKEGYIPDLAGVGNILVTPEGQIKLVDINNISRISNGLEIPTDDKGYPVCDKSIQALFLIESKLAGSALKTEGLYKHYLTPKRLNRLSEVERTFHLTMKVSSYPPRHS